jgi:hypothetical protein
MAGEVMLINPRRRRRKHTATKRRVRRVRRVRRHNPTMSRKRRTHRRRRVNARRHSRRNVRRNPKLLGINVMQIAGFAGGAIVTEILASYLAKMIPAEWKLDANTSRIGTKAVVGVGLPMVLKMTKLVPSGIANALAVGGGIVVLIDVFATYVAPKMGLTLGAYEQLSEYRMLPAGQGFAGMDEPYGESAYA